MEHKENVEEEVIKVIRWKENIFRDTAYNIKNIIIHGLKENFYLWK